MSTELTKRQHEALYDELARFYDLADDVISTIEAKDAPDAEFQTILASPLIIQLNESTEILENCYVNYASQNGSSHQIVKKTESEMKKIFDAVVDFLEEIKAIPEDIGEVKNKTKIKMKKAARILRDLVENIEQIASSALVNSFEGEISRLKEFKKFIQSVMNIGIHSMLITRALKAIGLVRKVDMVEPGQRLARIGMVSNPYTFAQRIAERTGNSGAQLGH